jgi:hypothetical protein
MPRWPHCQQRTTVRRAEQLCGIYHPDESKIRCLGLVARAAAPGLDAHVSEPRPELTVRSGGPRGDGRDVGERRIDRDEREVVCCREVALLPDRIPASLAARVRLGVKLNVLRGKAALEIAERAPCVRLGERETVCGGQRPLRVHERRMTVLLSIAFQVHGELRGGRGVARSGRVLHRIGVR